VKGLKVRPANGTIAQFMTLLGATNVQVPAPEARDALEKGVAEAITFPWNSMYIFGIDRATTHHVDIPFYVAAFALMFNKDAYARLAPGQKQVIDAHCTNEWAEKITRGWSQDEESGRAKLAEAQGHTIIKLTEAEIAAWRKAAEPLTVRWAEAVAKKGLNADEVLARLKKELAARQAQY
jgi:TRAP-type C4-dicarboxylate transport system substrate-binding protein